MDSRVKKLSRLLTGYSCGLQPGEKVLIEYEGKETRTLVRQLIRDVYGLGAVPFVAERDASVLREVLMEASGEQLELQYGLELQRMEQMDAFIGIRGGDNIAELSDVPPEKLQLYDRLTLPVDEQRVNGTKWVILRYPNPSMAQLAGKSLAGFEDFFFDVCTMDYGRMSQAMDELAALMNRTDRVRLAGPGTDLTFSIKGIPAVKCDGKANIPDGEVYTAPVRDSVNGVIRYNAASEMEGFVYENVRFEVENGKIIRAEAQRHGEDQPSAGRGRRSQVFRRVCHRRESLCAASHEGHPLRRKDLRQLSFDAGAGLRRRGQRKPVSDSLGSGHGAAGGLWPGGEIWFDDVLIRKDGRFVIDGLRPLNPENLR